ncbi:ATP-binding cassette domain-containing protein [bacterium]|nr:ATP-binding cassette domain-containing protein [bacterium]
MISTENLTLNFGGRRLFEDVSLKFTPGNCYGVIGANGAGKSTFLKILAGQISPDTGSVSITPNERLAYLKQNHFEYDDCEVLKTVIMGNPELYAVAKERDELYAKDDFTDADGDRASDLEEKYGDLGGWDADSNAGILLAGLGIGTEYHTRKVRELTGAEKVKVLLAQALFGDPHILLLDEPTNHLDVRAIRWLEEFLLECEQTVIVVSHDRHFLNQVCTHTVDIDFKKIQIYTGNYDFWYESSQLKQRMLAEKTRKAEEKAVELKNFIARFSANASKSRQATSRKKQLEKLTLDDIAPSSRQYPGILFKPNREAGDQLLKVRGITKTIDGQKVLDNISFEVQKGDKIAFVGSHEISRTTLFKIISGELAPDSGEYVWGITTSQAYMPKDNAEYFEQKEINLVDWLRQFSEEQSETFLRGFLGRMLFSGEETQKKVGVLSGGERVRCMLARIMLTGANVLILDEPTNHLDLESITSLNNSLIRFPGTVLFASHDQQFNQTLANRVIELSPSKVADFRNSYEEYQASTSA